jgi:hypothetical protein
VFRRRKGDSRTEGEPVDEVGTGRQDAIEPDADSAEGADSADRVGGEPSARRPRGPWDVEDAPEDDHVRLDLGCMLVPGMPGVEIQVNVDEASGAVAAVTAIHGQSALQLQAFAAARGEALWPQVRRELAAGITKDGGLADVEGSDDPDAGTAATVKAKLPFPQPDGSMALADVRFFGTDGPRWMLRGVLSGAAAADPAAAVELLELYRGVVVVRGSEAFAPSEPLPLRLPEQQDPPAPSPASDRTRLDPEGTGQRIAEIR